MDGAELLAFYRSKAAAGGDPFSSLEQRVAALYDDPTSSLIFASATHQAVSAKEVDASKIRRVAQQWLGVHVTYEPCKGRSALDLVTGSGAQPQAQALPHLLSAGSKVCVRCLEHVSEGVSPSKKVKPLTRDLLDEEIEEEAVRVAVIAVLNERAGKPCIVPPLRSPRWPHIQYRELE